MADVLDYVQGYDTRWCILGRHHHFSTLAGAQNNTIKI